MQDGSRCNHPVRSLVTVAGAIAGLMMLLTGGLIPVGFLIPSTLSSPIVLELPSTWQVPALLLCSLVSGPRSGVIAAIAYITIGLVHLPVFNAGGSLSYIFTPGFGYILGLIPAAFISGRLAQQDGMNGFLPLMYSAFAGLFCLHICGITNLIFGSMFYRWPNNLAELIFSYSLGPLPTQLALCASVGILALFLRRLLLIK